MKRFKICFVIALVASAGARAQLKVPHSHQPKSGGLVLMLGDDHVELSQSKSQLVLDLSDKLRDPVKVEDVQIELRRVSDQRAVPYTVDAKNPHRALVALPKQDIEIKMFRIKNVPKGQLLKKDFLKVDLSRVPVR